MNKQYFFLSLALLISTASLTFAFTGPTTSPTASGNQSAASLINQIAGTNFDADNDNLHAISQKIVSSYGDLYESNEAGSTVTVTTAGNYYGWTTASEGIVAGTGYITTANNSTADRLVVGSNGAGTYHVSVFTSFRGTVSALVNCNVFHNGVKFSKLSFSRKLGTGGDVGSASLMSLIDLSANDYLDLRCTADGNGDSIIFEQVNFSLERIST